jgi:AhpC/TSA family
MLNNTSGRLARAVEIATNFSIILVALIGTTVLVKNYLLRTFAPAVSEVQREFSGRTRAAGNDTLPGSQPAAGAQVSLPGVDWGASSETVVLALSNKCHFCSESAPFYQRLTRELAQRKDVRLVAVFPQETEEAKKYLNQLAVPIADVRQGSLGSLGVRGTPTLMIVDRTGTIKQSWTGRLSAERESEVLSRIKT